VISFVWRKAFYLTLFTLLIMGGATAVLQAQSDSDAESGYPAPPPPETEQADEVPYPPPTPFTLEPLPTPTPFTLEEIAPTGDEEPVLLPWSDQMTPAADTVGGSGQPAPPTGATTRNQTTSSGSSLMSKLFLWVAFTAAALIFAAAVFWSIILFNRQTTARR
jgi:hypothetical protein